MSAVWTVRVRAVDLRRALHGICGVDRDGVLIHVILVHVMQMAIMKVIHMAVMVNRSVPAIRTMLYECGSRGVSRYMQPLAMLLLTCWLPFDSLSTMEIIARTGTQSAHKSN